MVMVKLYFMHNYCFILCSFFFFFIHVSVRSGCCICCFGLKTSETDLFVVVLTWTLVSYRVGRYVCHTRAIIHIRAGH